MENYNKLTPAEVERLAILAEECGEVIQIIGKILRHGYESDNLGKMEFKNRELLERELGDVDAAVQQLINAEDISSNKKYMQFLHKCKKHGEGKYLHHQEIKQLQEDHLVYNY